METQKKISVMGVLTEGISLGMKNAVSLLVATVLWIVTIWIPYLNVGTTIAMTTIPIELSKGKVISPVFIFDSKYRKYMGEYFTLIGLMAMAVIPALFFMIVPAIVICIGWSLAIYIYCWTKELLLVKLWFRVTRRHMDINGQYSAFSSF